MECVGAYSVDLHTGIRVGSTIQLEVVPRRRVRHGLKISYGKGAGRELRNPNYEFAAECAVSPYNSRTLSNRFCLRLQGRHRHATHDEKDNELERSS